MAVPSRSTMFLAIASAKRYPTASSTRSSGNGNAHNYARHLASLRVGAVPYGDFVEMDGRWCGNPPKSIAATPSPLDEALSELSSRCELFRLPLVRLSAAGAVVCRWCGTGERARLRGRAGGGSAAGRGTSGVLFAVEASAWRAINYLCPRSQLRPSWCYDGKEDIAKRLGEEELLWLLCGKTKQLW